MECGIPPQGLQDATTLQLLQDCGVLVWLYWGDAPLETAYILCPLLGQAVSRMTATYSLSPM